MADNPNFLVICTDQLRADWLGCMGHPVVRTPHIDNLAAKGAKFTNFHVASPVCMPNRAAMMTGRMPSACGARTNGRPLPLNATTFVDVLAKAGYDTALIGKSHLQPFTTVPPYRAASGNPLIADAWAPDDADYGKEQPDRYAGSERYAFDAPYYGFRHVDMVTSHGDRAGGHYAQWFRTQHPDWQDLHDEANELPHSYTCPQAYRTPIPEELYPTAYVGNQAADWISTRSADAPFFAFVSFGDPHHPFNPPGRYWDMYDPDDFAVDLPYEAHNNPTPPMRYLSDRFTAGQGPETPQSAFRASKRHVQEVMALTAGMITLIDDQVGRILTALEQSGLSDNTVVVFTSDHGDYLGDFNMILKGAVPMRGITRVPMIWSEPDAKPVEVAAMASTIDLSASVLARAGLDPYHGIQGRSFLPALNGAPHRKQVFVEYNDALARLGFDTPARVRSITSPDWRLTTYGGENWGELYDLRSDPHETKNLWDDPDYSEQKSALSLALIEEMTAAMDESPPPTLLA
ncbi:MAG: sulfatase-like hydrolase/transferase [Pseudomonadota bacterium]